MKNLTKLTAELEVSSDLCIKGLYRKLLTHFLYAPPVPEESMSVSTGQTAADLDISWFLQQLSATTDQCFPQLLRPLGNTKGRTFPRPSQALCVSMLENILRYGCYDAKGSVEKDDRIRFSMEVGGFWSKILSWDACILESNIRNNTILKFLPHWFSSQTCLSKSGVVLSQCCAQSNI